MPDHKKTKAKQHKNIPISDSAAGSATTDFEAVGKAAKEQEPAKSHEAELAGVLEKYKEADKKAEKDLKEVVGEEAGLSEPEPSLPPDVKDAGVKSPDTDASEVIEQGAVVELPIDEKTYHEGQNAKITSKVTVKKEVYGVSSIVALALFVGRLVKRAHHHAKSVVFKKEK